MNTETLTGLTADIVIAFVSANSIEPTELPGLIASTYTALSELGAPVATAAPIYEPAVSIRSSIKPDHLISLIDGKRYKMLKRHLQNNGLTPDEYRARYGLPASYPMVAPAYSEKRRDLAKKIGLGRKPGAVVRKVA